MEAGRVSVAVEVTGMSLLHREIERAQASVQKFAGAAAGSLTGAERSFTRTDATASSYARSLGRAGQATDSFGRSSATAAPGLQRIQAGLDRANLSAGRFVSQIGAAAGALVGLTAAQRAASGFISMADEATRLEGRLRLVTSSSEELARVQNQLFEVSQRTRSDFGANVELYTRASVALQSVGASSAEVLRFTEALNQAFVISGATTQEQTSATIQLSQALASGALRSDEFNSVNESAPRIMQALADAIGVPVGQMRALAEEGRLTTSVLKDGVLSQAGLLAQEFGRIPRTLSSAMVNLRNDMLMVVAGVNASTGSTARLVGEVDNLRASIRSTDFASGLAYVIRDITATMDAARDFAGQVSDFYTGVQSEVAAVQQWFGETSQSINDFAESATGWFRSISDASSETARLLPQGWADGMAQIHDIVSTGVQNVVRAMATIPAAGHALRGGIFGEGFQATFEAEQQRIVDAINGAGAAIGDAVGFHVTLDPVVVEMEEAAEAATNFATEAAAVGGASVNAARGVVQLGESSSGTAKAMSDAASAARALFTEADRAVASFFPMETAAAEAERLGAIVRDTTNGLTGLQRSALTMQIDENFRRASEQANRANGSVGAFRDTAVGSAQSIGDAFIQNVGDVFSQIFSQATSDGENFFDSILRGFAGLGSQLAAAGAKNLFGSLFGMPPSGQTQSAAGIGSFPLAANDNSVATMRTVGALNDNLRQSSRSALDVARAFNGLSEKADAPVLDSFMQASGTWNNLSAKDTAWCAAFASAAIVQAGGRGTGSNLASSFMGWGQGTNAPQVGDIVVLKPQAAGASGHVGFVAGFGDGKVQVFGGNQSNAANVRSFGLDQVRGYRTGVGVSGAGIGGSMSNDPWNGLRSVTPGVNGPMARGFLYQNAQGQTVNQMGLTRGQQLMGGIGAGVGIFSQGVQSGSAGMGALSGALGGYQAAGALGIAGPIGALAGAGLGLLGGLFGGRQKRKQEHQQRAEAWAAQAQEWQAYQDEVRTGVGPTSGLRASQEAMANRLTGFVQAGSAAWKMGSNNSSALFSQVGAELGEYFARTNAEFGRAYEAQIASLNAGQGLSGPFISARDEILEAGKTLATFVDDTRVVFGDGSVEAQRAAEASIAQLRALLTGGQELSDIAAAVEQMRGAAAGLHTQLEALGVSAADAGAAVSQDLAAAMNRLRGDFAQGIQDQLWSLDGKGYITEFRQFFTDIDDAIQDALLVGADRGLVDELFVRQAQSMVDGAQLSGEAFNELLSVFPRLAGVVREFSEAAEEAAKRTADQIAALKLSYDDRFFETTIDTSTETGALARFDRYAAREREEEIKAGGDAILELERALAAERGQIVKQFADRAIEEQKRALESAKSFLDGFTRDIGSYLDGLRAGPDSPLTGQARVDEARKQFEEQLGLARGGDRDALGSITSYADRLLEADRAYNTSSPAAQATFDEVTRALEGLPKQLKAEDIVSAEIAKAAKDLQETIRQATLDLAARISTDFATFDANFDGFLTIEELRPHFAGTELELRRIFTEIDLNGDGQISRLESLLASDGLTRSTLQSAFLLGPNATAGALAPHFARLDTSLDGLLDFDEMKVALGGIATDAQIRSLMAEMDLNGDLQISRLEMLLASDGVTRSALTSALSAGPDATARLTASALANHFLKLDTSVNGLLDLSEMRAALGGIATDDQIRQMMTVLDANGDGQISHLELLNARANAQVGSLNDLQALTRLTWDASRVSQTYQERTRHFTEVNSQLLQGISSTLSQSLSMQERIRANLAEANGGRELRQFAMGGISSVPAIFGEAGPEAAVPLPDGRTIPVTLSMPRMPAMPQMANDNGAMQAELRGLRADVARLEKALVAATLASGENVRAGVDDIAEETRRGNKTADRKSRLGQG